MNKHARIVETCSAAFCLSFESRNGFWVVYDARFKQAKCIRCKTDVSSIPLRIVNVLGEMQTCVLEQYLGSKRWHFEKDTRKQVYTRAHIEKGPERLTDGIQQRIFLLRANEWDFWTRDSKNVICRVTQHGTAVTEHAEKCVFVCECVCSCKCTSAHPWYFPSCHSRTGHQRQKTLCRWYISLKPRTFGCKCFSIYLICSGFGSNMPIFWSLPTSSLLLFWKPNESVPWYWSIKQHFFTNSCMPS